MANVPNRKIYYELIIKAIKEEDWELAHMHLDSLKDELILCAIQTHEVPNDLRQWFQDCITLSGKCTVKWYS